VTQRHANVVQIDPKRAIPREEQERTSKIFVGGVSQEATEEDFTKFFKQFGRVVDATLMMDKETGRPRGFGFVTFDGDAAVDATLRQPLQILGKPIEVKRAQPRGNMRDDEGGDKKFGRGNKFNNRDQGGNGNANGSYDNQQNAQPQGGNGAMTPAMMAQYWQRMQQYFQQMQQNLAQQQVGGGGMPNPMAAMGGMNPMQMQQMQAQMMGGGGPGMNRNTGSPNPQNMMGGPGGMNSMQMQQMMQGGGGNGGFNGGGNQGMQGGPGAGPRPAYTAQDQLAFEQQKYEQQQQRRMQQQGGYGGQGGPTAWDGMYEDMPQPGGAGRGGGFKNQRGRQGSSQPPTAPANAPINAPTGPKNAGKPGANYRGGGRHTGQFRHQPYGGRGG
jgi:RNA-binding protein Musashi